MRIALVTCRTLPDWECDDRPLLAAFEARGAAVEEPAWDDPDCDWAAFDAALVRTTWDYQERLDEFLVWAERCGRATRLVHGAPILRWNTDKLYLRGLAAAGIPIVPTEWLDGAAIARAARDPEFLGECLARRGWDRAFLKPRVGATARATLPFSADADGLALASAHLAAHSAESGFLLQPYLDRVESEGELSAVFFGGALSHTVRKTPAPGDYRVQDDFGGRDQLADLSPPLLQQCEALLARLDATRPWGPAGSAAPLVYARIDLLPTAEGGHLLGELEVFEPSLFFRHAPEGAGRLADAVLASLAPAG